MSTTELYGGARISYVFTDTFGRTLDSINPTEGEADVANIRAD